MESAHVVFRASPKHAFRGRTLRFVAIPFKVESTFMVVLGQQIDVQSLSAPFTLKGNP